MTAAAAAAPHASRLVVHLATAAVDLMGWPVMLQAARSAALMHHRAETGRPARRHRTTLAVAFGVLRLDGDAVGTDPGDARVVRISTTIEEER